MHLLINDDDAPILEQVNLPILEAFVSVRVLEISYRINCAEVNLRDEINLVLEGTCKKYRLGWLNIG